MLWFDVMAFIAEGGFHYTYESIFGNVFFCTSLILDEYVLQRLLTKKKHEFVKFKKNRNLKIQHI